MDNGIKIENLEVSYGGNPIIQDLNLEIPEGKITMLIGTNGCGKSTLLKSIGRILPSVKGRIAVCGTDVKKGTYKELAKKMSILPQSPTAPAGLLVKELVAYGRFPYQKPFGGLRPEDSEMIEWAMEATRISEFRDRKVEALSGGQRQRAFIAMTLAQGAKVMLLDEPTTYLDISHQTEILKLLREINKKNRTTMVIVIHELNNAAKYADHLVGMKAGQIVFQGAPKAVVTKENLKLLYNIDAKLQLDDNGQYPICVDYELAN